MKPPAGVAVLLALWLSCDTQQPVSTTTRVHIVSVDDEGKPVEGVSISANETPLGTTNAAGALDTRLSGPPGFVFRLSATCPAPLQAHGTLPPLTLRAIQPLTPASAGLTVDVGCARPQRTVAIVVRTRTFERPLLELHGRRGRTRRSRSKHGESPPRALCDVPVMVKGQVVARTDAKGLAHVALQGVPGAHLELTLDTSAESHETLRPRSPALTLEVPPEDDVRVIEQTFTEDRAPAVRPRKPPPPPPHTIQIISGTTAPLVELKRPARSPRRP